MTDILIGPKMLIKIINILTGIALIFIGAHFTIYDWDAIHGFSVPSSTGVLFILFGLIWLLLLLRKKK